MHCSHERWHAMPLAARIPLYALFGACFVGFFAILFGYVTMALWNGVVAEVFSLPALTFWQAIGILVLARLLVGRFSPGRGHHGSWRMRHRGHLYAQWWEEEGESAFQAYRQRKRDERPEQL